MFSFTTDSQPSTLCHALVPYPPTNHTNKQSTSTLSHDYRHCAIGIQNRAMLSSSLALSPPVIRPPYIHTYHPYADMLLVSFSWRPVKVDFPLPFARALRDGQREAFSFN